MSARALLALCLVLLPGPARSQDAAEARREAGLPFMRVFTPKEYGAQSQNWAIVQDPRGVIYVGNNDGVLEFDGVRWRLIRVTNGAFVRSLAVDASGRVWVGAFGEVGYLEPDALGQMRYVSVLERVPAEARDFADVWNTFPTAQGVYFASYRRLLRLQGDRVQVWTPETSFHRSHLVGDRLLVFEVGRGLLELVQGELRLVTGTEILAEDKVYVMIPWDGAILVDARKHGLLLLERESLRPFPTEADAELRRGLIHKAALLADGRLAVGTLAGGLYLLDHGGRCLGHLDRARGLPDDKVLAVSTDREGGLWLGLDRGIARVQVGSSLTRFDLTHGFFSTSPILVRYNDGRPFASKKQSRGSPNPRRRSGDNHYPVRKALHNKSR